MGQLLHLRRGLAVKAGRIVSGLSADAARRAGVEALINCRLGAWQDGGWRRLTGVATFDGGRLTRAAVAFLAGTLAIRRAPP